MARIHAQRADACAASTVWANDAWTMQLLRVRAAEMIALVWSAEALWFGMRPLHKGLDTDDHCMPHL